MANQYKVVYGLSNGASFCDLQQPSFQGHAKYDVTVYCEYRTSTSLTTQPLCYDIIKYCIARCQYGEIDLWKLRTFFTALSNKGFYSIMSGMFLWSLQLILLVMRCHVHSLIGHVDNR